MKTYGIINDDRNECGLIFILFIAHFELNYII